MARRSGATPDSANVTDRRLRARSGRCQIAGPYDMTTTMRALILGAYKVERIATALAVRGVDEILIRSRL